MGIYEISPGFISEKRGADYAPGPIVCGGYSTSTDSSPHQSLADTPLPCETLLVSIEIIQKVLLLKEYLSNFSNTRAFGSDKLSIFHLKNIAR